MSDNIAEIVGGDVNTAADGADVTAQAAAAESAEKQGSTEQAATDGAAGEKAPKGFVEYGALHQEREERKKETAERKRLAAEVERMLQTQAARDAKLEERLDALTKANQPAGPTLEESPAQFLAQELGSVKQSLAEQQRAQQERMQAEQQQSNIQRVAGLVQQLEAHFSQTTPDYQDAVAHLRDMRVRELTDGYGLDPNSASQQAQRELVEFAFYNAQRGANPAEAAYRMAAVRGYQRRASDQPQQTPAQKLETQQKGAQAKSLGGGGAPAGKLTVEALLQMSPEEFAAATSGEKWQKAVGG